MSHTFIVPGQIFTGRYALEENFQKICMLGKKPLIVTDRLMDEIGHLNKLLELYRQADSPYTVYVQQDGEPTDKMVDEGVRLFKEGGCDYLIAFGGGSPIDVMKATAAMTVLKGNLKDYMGKVIEGRLPPMAAIPTTAGTGSEATQFTIITDTENDVKMLLKGSCLMPDMAIIDAEFSMTLPPSVTAATGMDALTHAAEAFTSRKAFELTDTFALSALSRIFTYLPRAYRDGKDEEARIQMSIAALEAGIAFNNASVTVVHGMSRPIGALFHVPHGISNAMLITECFRYVVDGARKQFACLARTVEPSAAKEDAVAAGQFIEQVEALCRTLQIPTLEAYGIDKQSFMKAIDKMAEDAIDSGSPSNTKKELSKEDIIKIYTNLW